MIITSNYYQIDHTDIDFLEFIKALKLLSPKGLMVLDYAGNKNEYEIDKSIIKLNKNKTIYSDENTVVIEYNNHVVDTLLSAKSLFFDNKLLYLDYNENCLLEWIEAGRYSSINISRKYVSDQTFRDFCKYLYINNYCVYSFI